MNELIILIKENLTDDLLKSNFLKLENKKPTTGHCYVATEALYHLLSDDDKLFISPAILKINDITHWFLKNKKTNEVIDITADQFDFKLDYSKSRYCGFLTKNPSKRCLTLINKIDAITSI